MSAPTQSDPAFKRRLVTAMLKEPASRRVPRSSSISEAAWSPRLVAAVVGLCLLSAAAVFLFLWHRDASAGPIASPLPVAGEMTTDRDAPEQHAVAGNTVADAPAARSNRAGGPADHYVTSAAPLDFQLKRSRSFEKVGPIGIRLLRVNLRRRTCDLTMRLNNHRTVQRRLQLNRPLEVRQEPAAQPLQIVVSSMARDSIAGVVASSPGDSSMAKRLD